MSQGTFLATAFWTFEEESRPATPFSSAGKVGMSLSQPSGSCRCCMRKSVSASFGYFAL